MSSACGTLLAGRYRLEQRIATGGYGEVWRGTDVMLSRPVAIKQLLAGHAQHAQTLARFRSEALHAAAVSHGNIARVYDYAEDDPPYLVMEFVEGPSLADLLIGEPMGPARAMDIVAQTASGLHVAHQAGLIHRDVKPGNVLLSQGSMVKITDFGISYVAGSVPVTATGMLMGTPGYIAPERLNGIPASPASDLYSLGIIAYECLMGAAPFTGVALEVALAHRDRPLPPLPTSIPADVAALVGELTAKDPRRRPGSAGEVAERAAQIRDRLGGGVTAAIPAAGPGSEPVPVPAPVTRVESVVIGPPVPAPSRAGRRLAWAAAGIITLALFGLLLASVLNPAPSPGRAVTAPSSSSSQRPAALSMVQVNAGSLIGQPVDAVVSKLRQLGLNPRVRWRASGQPPGQVLSVEPGGQVATGSLITVLAVAQPGPPGSDAHGKRPPKLGHGPGKGGHHGHGDGNAQGND